MAEPIRKKGKRIVGDAVAHIQASFNNTIISITDRQADEQAMIAAHNCAVARSFHSYFNQYILTDHERGYIVVDEGDYGALPQHLMDRVVDAVPSKMIDEH